MTPAGSAARNSAERQLPVGAEVHAVAGGDGRQRPALGLGEAAEDERLAEAALLGGGHGGGPGGGDGRGGADVLGHGSSWGKCRWARCEREPAGRRREQSRGSAPGTSGASGVRRTVRQVGTGRPVRQAGTGTARRTAGTVAPPASSGVRGVGMRGAGIRGRGGLGGLEDTGGRGALGLAGLADVDRHEVVEVGEEPVDEGVGGLGLVGELRDQLARAELDADGDPDDAVVAADPAEGEGDRVVAGGQRRQRGQAATGGRAAGPQLDVHHDRLRVDGLRADRLGRVHDVDAEVDPEWSSPVRVR